MGCRLSRCFLHRIEDGMDLRERILDILHRAVCSTEDGNEIIQKPNEEDRENGHSDGEDEQQQILARVEIHGDFSVPPTPIPGLVTILLGNSSVGVCVDRPRSERELVWACSLPVPAFAVRGGTGFTLPRFRLAAKSGSSGNKIGNMLCFNHE